MKPHHRTPSARVQLSEKLLGYTATTAATFAAASTAGGQTVSFDTYFGGSLPSITMSSNYASDSGSANFTVGNATFTLTGFKRSFYSPGFPGLPGSPGHFTNPDPGTPGHLVGGHFTHPNESTSGHSTGSFFSNPDPGTPGHYVGTIPSTSGFPAHRSFGGYLRLQASGADLSLNSYVFRSNAFLFQSSSGHVTSNAFGGTGGNIHFRTSAGGTGFLHLQLGYNTQGPNFVGVLGDSSFTTAIPESGSVAGGLGLLALGFAGIREHRRRRAAAKASRPTS